MQRHQTDCNVNGYALKERERKSEGGEEREGEEREREFYWSRERERSMKPVTPAQTNSNINNFTLGIPEHVH